MLLTLTLLLLVGCERGGEPSARPAIPRPELTVNLNEKVGQEVEVTGVLVSVSIQATKKNAEWSGETTANLECKGMALTCRFPRTTTGPPIQMLRNGLPDVRLVTLRGTVVSVEPPGNATLAECVVVHDPPAPPFKPSR